MSSVLVVVIVGVIIAAIAGATLSDGPKPPTRQVRPERAAPPVPAPVAAWQPPPLSPAEPVSRSISEIDERGFLLRLRSAALLCLTVVVLGSVAAGLLGAIVLVGAHFVNSALG